MLDLETARPLDSLRGARGDHALRRTPSEVFLGEVIRTIDEPLAPMGDAESLRRLMRQDRRHSALYRVLLDVRNATAGILDRTSLADLAGRPGRGRR